MAPQSLDFFDLRTRAELLDLCDDAEGAAELRAASLEVAREVDLVCYGYQLLWRNRVTDAIEILERCAARHPDSWNVWDTLGDAYSQHGDLRKAIDCYSHASQLVDSDSERLRIDAIVRDLVALGAIAS